MRKASNFIFSKTWGEISNKRLWQTNHSQKQRPSSYWGNKLLEQETATCSGNKAGWKGGGRRGTSLLFAPCHEMPQKLQLSCSWRCRRFIVRSTFVEKTERQNHYPTLTIPEPILSQHASRFRSICTAT